MICTWNGSFKISNDLEASSCIIFFSFWTYIQPWKQPVGHIAIPGLTDTLKTSNFKPHCRNEVVLSIQSAPLSLGITEIQFQKCVSIHWRNSQLRNMYKNLMVYFSNKCYEKNIHIRNLKNEKTWKCSRDSWDPLSSGCLPDVFI